VPGLGRLQLFTPYFDILAPEVGQVPTLVFGAIWRYCQMTDNVCKATLQTIADRLSVNRITIIRAIQVLITTGLIEDLTPDLRNRPHTYRLTIKAQSLVKASAVSESDTQPAVSVTESDSTSDVETSAVTESDGECKRGACSQCSRHPPENLAEARFTGGPAHNARGIPPRISPKLGSPGGLLTMLAASPRESRRSSVHRGEVT
jgi:hypothetical protein